MTVGIATMPFVLMYHSVDTYEHDPHLITVSPDRFDRQMRWLQARGLRGVSVRELLDAQAAGSARGLVALTFDDGYADFATRVTPLLVRYGFTATVFMVAGHVAGRNEWDDGPRKPLMDHQQLRAVADVGMEVASHGLRHRRLPDLTESELHEELHGSRDVLERMIDRPVRGFAYPYGVLTAREAEAVEKAGYDYGCAIWDEHPCRHALARTYVGERDHRLRLTAKALRHRLRWRTRI
ncbi:polysaccharide deacetylase family protein [Actinomadura kijaniata]|uniref:polysaccharide deacetylase family protein n=1 Tax=Actinomadura kijaniata TaxID=46161 RepID=UPI00082D3BB2|nr:polysaccharide deacetylase family protein [Actinomadura kijaniata]